MTPLPRVYGKRRDDNEDEVVSTLRKAGVAVWRLDQPADLLVGHSGRFYTLEVKNGSKPPSARKLTLEEQLYASACIAMSLPHHIVKSPEEALEVLGLLGKIA